jgi:hypothetical protein
VHKTNKQTQQTVPQFPISHGEEEKEEKKVQSQSRTIRIVTDVAVLGGNRVSQYRCRASERRRQWNQRLGYRRVLTATTLTTDTAKTAKMTKMPDATKTTHRFWNSAKRADRDGTNQLCPATRRSALRPRAGRANNAANCPKIAFKSSSSPKPQAAVLIDSQPWNESQFARLSFTSFAVNCQTSGPTDRKSESNTK